MSSKDPTVSVLLPCYNAAAFLTAALDSILEQTHKDFEVIAIDDGSQDMTASILQESAARDTRIRLIRNDGNRGLIYSLNAGVRLARGALIARMDADDIAEPERLQHQLHYFARHPETQILSTDVTYITDNGSLLYNPQPYRFSDAVLRFLTFFVNPICHPTVMGRRETFERFPYADDAVHSEDYELWNRMIAAGVVIRNLPQRLLRFRPNLGSVSSRNQERQTEVFLRAGAGAIRDYFDITVEPPVHRILTARMTHRGVRGSDLKSALRLFHDMQVTYIRREGLGRTDRALLHRFASRQLANILHHAYRRSSCEESSRRIAAGAALRMSLFNPLPLSTLMLQRVRGRLRR
jgi:glycosyltransferase involved in cell wall biosynthesis